MASLWGELKRRNVVRVAIAYAIVGWLILQLTDVMVSLLTLPDWVGRFIFLLLFIGFFLALFFAWVYELTPEGLKRETDVAPVQSVTRVTGRKLDFIIIGVLLVALGIFALERFVLLPERQSAADTRSGVISGETRKSIAVLPFVNMSPDPDQEYFSEGLSEEILNLLAKNRALKVIGRTSSFAFKGINQDLREIGRQLGAATLLEGSVRKSGDRVRITAQLIDAADGAHLWSDTYDRTLTDIFAIQDDVASAIINALEIHVGGKPSRGRPTDNTDAYAEFLRAGVAAGRYDWRKVRDFCTRAVELDPNFAEAHELLAYSAWRMAGGFLPFDEAFDLMRSSSEQALVVDPDLVLARALYRSSDGDNYSILAEIQAFDEAAARQPDDPRILDSLLYDLFVSGYLNEALTIAMRLVELDPLSPVANGRLPTALFAVGRTDEAFAALQIFDQLDPGFTHWFVGETYLAFGQEDAAISSFRVSLSQGGVADSEWVPELIRHGRDPHTGQAYLDRRIPQIVATIPQDFHVDLQHDLMNWYLYFGHLERYFDLIFEQEPSARNWAKVGDFLASGVAYRHLGFIRHPRYLDVARAIGMIDVWDQRGPPDFCRKTDGKWICR
ncbi:MAG: hypothetical protein R3192_10595 [Woeseiaceae bacterium]|nr:hypothetical protein [Woeseiaceae bacterium]